MDPKKKTVDMIPPRASQGPPKRQSEEDEQVPRKKSCDCSDFSL